MTILSAISNLLGGLEGFIIIAFFSAGDTSVNPTFYKKLLCSKVLVYCSIQNNSTMKMFQMKGAAFLLIFKISCRICNSALIDARGISHK